MTSLLDHRGNPIKKEALQREVAGPTLAGVRSPIGGYPGDGLNPRRLANILREADQGDPLRYFELAEQIEERDAHYAAVLGTRKRSVTQIEATVEAASDEAFDVALADMVRDWIARDELADEMFDILDAIGKGVSFTEIIWDTSEGQWRPARLEWRDPRFFTFDRVDGRTPMLRGGEEGSGQDAPLPPFKFIVHQIKAKSGLPVRSGIARIAAWNWMFKAFTQRDWAIFAQTFGQPVRVGKFHSGASEADKATLYRAVANIAGDCAAIIPDGMMIEFIESANVGAGADLYEHRADWLDRQTSKAVLGQTGTTDMKSGGLGDGGNQVHDRVAGDIERADCAATEAVLNRDLVRPWVDLERGPQKLYPRIRIRRPQQEDLQLLTTALPVLVDMGMRIEASEIRDKFGLTDPAPDAELLKARARKAAPAPAEEEIEEEGGDPAAPGKVALQAQQAPADPDPGPADLIGDRMVDDAAPEMAAMLGTIEAMVAAASDLGELREMLRNAYPQLDRRELANKVALGLMAAELAGISDLEDESA